MISENAKLFEMEHFIFPLDWKTEPKERNKFAQSSGFAFRDWFEEMYFKSAPSAVVYIDTALSEEKNGR